MPLSFAEARQLLAALEQGAPPPPGLMSAVTVGLDGLLDDWTRELRDYVGRGGGLLRVVAAPPGSGKTHLGESLEARGAKLGFLVCHVDVQAQRVGGDDLALYGSVCRGLTLPEDHLRGERSAAGLERVLADVAARMNDAEIRERLRAARLPVPSLAPCLARLVSSIRQGLMAIEPGWRALLAVTCGERLPGATSVSRLRQLYPRSFDALRKVPGRRDARLWLHSMLVALRALGFPGVVMVFDEHDGGDARALDRSIEQLRTQLDHLVEGNIPGVFALYLVLDDFLERTRRLHNALEQRIVPVLRTPLPTRVLTELGTVRDLPSEQFLETLAARLHELVVDEPMSDGLRRHVHGLAKAHGARLGGTDTRAFVKQFAQLVHLPAPKEAA